MKDGTVRVPGLLSLSFVIQLVLVKNDFVLYLKTSSWNWRLYRGKVNGYFMKGKQFFLQELPFGLNN